MSRYILCVSEDIEAARVADGDTDEEEGVVGFCRGETNYNGEGEGRLTCGRWKQNSASVEACERFMKLGLGFDELSVDRAEGGAVAECKWVEDRFLDRVVGISARAIDVSDGVAGHAGDAGVRGRMILEIELRIIKRPAEKGSGVVTSGAPARSLRCRSRSMQLRVSSTRTDSLVVVSEMMTLGNSCRRCRGGLHEILVGHYRQAG